MHGVFVCVCACVSVGVVVVLMTLVASSESRRATGRGVRLRACVSMCVWSCVSVRGVTQYYAYFVLLLLLFVCDLAHYSMLRRLFVLGASDSTKLYLGGGARVSVINAGRAIARNRCWRARALVMHACCSYIKTSSTMVTASVLS